MTIYKGNTQIGVTFDSTPAVQSEGQFSVQVIDYDGTIVKIEKLNTGDTFTLPSAPTHSGLTFQGWTSPVTITNNQVTITNEDITIGPIYNTTSGLCEFVIYSNSNHSGSSTVTLNMNGTKNWGDGTIDTLTSHAYSNVQRGTVYNITCDGDSITGNNIFESSNLYLYEARLSNQITSIGNKCSNDTLCNISLPSTLTGTISFNSCTNLGHLIVPSGVTTVYVGHCTNLRYIALPLGVSELSGAFNSCYSLISVTLPEGINDLYTDEGTFYYCYSLQSVTIPSTVDIICGYYECFFTDCYALNRVTFREGFEEVDSETFNDCPNLRTVKFPKSLTRIGAAAFSNCSNIIEYDFSELETIPTLEYEDAFGLVTDDIVNVYGILIVYNSKINNLCKIKVPQSLYDEWIEETNWAVYADYIIGV